ncbi:hypothetical protein [Methylomarinovum caldicuralii]|uniref:hypothetical protein n=1 Tax=Methylomarinovum caldicuralii TaxID=438856 RepID=UPI00295508D4|nr:hypothetical protein [Methylomarinovum caldicuralii]
MRRGFLGIGFGGDHGFEQDLAAFLRFLATELIDRYAGFFRFGGAAAQLGCKSDKPPAQ